MTTTAVLPAGAPGPVTDRTVIGENLSLPLFRTLSGVLAGHPYLKVVVDRIEDTWHLLDTAVHPFHVNYIATRVLGMELTELDSCLDAFNASVYMDPERRFLLGVLSLHTDEDAEGRERPFLVLETTEADTMNGRLLEEFYTFVRHRVDGRLPLLLKPANHGQEHELAAISDVRVPRILGHQLFGNRTRTPLNPGEAVGRLRYFRTLEEYTAEADGLGWSDIVAMPCLPDDVPRVAGFLNTSPGTPLSHTNVLASGWGIPNAIVRDLERMVDADVLDGAWVRYRVEDDEITIVPLAHAPTLDAPAWHQQRIRMEPPLLEDVRRCGCTGCAAPTGTGTGPRPPTSASSITSSTAAAPTSPPSTGSPGRRAPTSTATSRPASAPRTRHRRNCVPWRPTSWPGSSRRPTGSPSFALQHRFLTSSPAVQQGLGKLKMALELDALDVLDALCLHLQQLIRNTPLPEDVSRQITQALPGGPATGRRLVVRSSSNAEDLPGFSAAGVYESITTVHGADELLDAVRQVWASLLSPRSVRLRHQAGISLDDTYMGVIIQEYVPADLGGVLVTCNPTRREDFRNVYLNCSPGSPETVVDGTTLPLQYLYNTVEGGGRTVALGSSGQDLPVGTRDKLARLALTGRLLQSHFSDTDLDHPLDIEWLMTDQGDFRLVQIRPYAL